MIPKRIHFVWVGGPMPSWAARNVEAFARLNPGHEITVHGEEVLLPEYIWRYAQLDDPAMKADLLRYSALERFGGWYFDVDYWPFRPVEDAERAWRLDGERLFVALVREDPTSPGRYGNGVLACGARCAALGWLRAAIEATAPHGRISYGPTMIRRLAEAQPELVTVAGIEWFNGLKPPWAGTTYRRIQATGDPSVAASLMEGTGGQLPYAMHLWASQYEHQLVEGHSRALRVVGDGPRRAVVLTVPIKDSHRERTADAIAEGLAACGCTVEVLAHEAHSFELVAELPEVVVMWNGRRTADAAIVAQARRMGATVLFVEHGFFGREEHLQVDHAGILHWASWSKRLNEPAPAAERLDRFYPNGIRRMARRRGGYALVLGQLAGDTQMTSSEIQGPIPLQRHVKRNMPAGITAYFRPHPAARETAPHPNHVSLPRLEQSSEATRYWATKHGSGLAAALDGAAFAITINSNAANEALAAGVPVLAFGPHLGIEAGVIRRTTLATLKADIEAMCGGWMPEHAAVENYLRWLASRQWRFDELRTARVMSELLVEAGVLEAPVTAETPMDDIDEMDWMECDRAAVACVVG